MKSMRLLLCLLVCSFQLRADIIYGDTDPVGVPRDLSINKIFAGYDSSQTTYIKNHILTHLSGDNLRMLASTSLLHLHNVSLELDGTYTFTHGSIEVVGKVEIIGSGHKFRLASHSIYIADSSELVIGDGVEFEFAPTSSLRTAVHFGSESSKLTLNSSTLTVNNNLGVHLIGGNLNIEGNCIIDNVFTDTHKALILGTNMSGTLGTGDGDCKLKINYGAKLTVKKAGIIFKNNGVGSLDASNGEGTLVIDSTGNFLFDSVVNLNDSGVSFDFSKLESLYQLGDVTGLNSTPVAEIPYNDLVRSVNFSPDGKYLAIGGDAGLDQEIAVYRFDGSSLTKVAEIAYNKYVLSVNFSPDGKYLAIGANINGLDRELAVYRFDGSSLTKVAEIPYNKAVLSVNFSPDGKYLAIGGTPGGLDQEIAVYRFDGSSLTKVAEIFYNAYVNSVNFSPDGKYLAIGGSGAGEQIAVYRFSGSSLTKVAEIDYTKTVLSVNFSPDGKYLAIGGGTLGPDQEIAVYRFDGSSLTKVAEIPYNDWVQSVNFSPDGKYLAIASDIGGLDEPIAVYRFDGSSLTKVAEIPYNTQVRSVNFSPDGKYLAIGAYSSGSDEPIAVYEMNYNLGERIANINNSTIKLSQDLKLENINLKTH